VCIGRDGEIPQEFFRVEDLPKGFHLQDPSHLRQEDLLTLWTFDLLPKDGQVGLMFSGCDPRDKRQEMGRGLAGRPREEAKPRRG